MWADAQSNGCPPNIGDALCWMLLIKSWHWVKKQNPSKFA